MIGQAFVNEKTKVYNDLQEGDFVVSFASSKLKISGLLLIPVFSDGHCIGVIELASITNFDQDRIDFFIEGTRNIGIALNAAKGREKEQQLLEETHTSLKNYRCSILNWKI